MWLWIHEDASPPKVSHQNIAKSQSSGRPCRTSLFQRPHPCRPHPVLLLFAFGLWDLRKTTSKSTWEDLKFQGEGGGDFWRLESYRVRIKGLRKNEGNKATNELWRYITQARLYARLYAYQTPHNSWCMACNCSCGWKSPSQILLQTFGQINNPEIPLIRWSSLYKLPFGVTSLGIRVPCNGSKPTG